MTVHSSFKTPAEGYRQSAYWDKLSCIMVQFDILISRALHQQYTLLRKLMMITNLMLSQLVD